MATDTRRGRDAIYAYYSNEIDLSHIPTQATSLSTLPSNPLLATPEVDLYRRPTLPPQTTTSPIPLPKAPVDQKKEAKIVRRQKKEQEDGMEKAKHEKLERENAKLERKQKRSEYMQMYQNQHEHQMRMGERRGERRQQLSLPIYPPSSASSASSAQSNTTMNDIWSPQLPAPNNEIYYHSSRYYHRARPANHSDAPYQHSHLDSLSFKSGDSQKMTLSEMKLRSQSLKSQSTKSMYDLRPWSGTPQSPTLDYHSGYDSDDTSMSRGWESLLDTLHSPTTVSSPMESPGLDSSFKDEMDLDQVGTALSNLTLSHDDNKNGNGRYLLVLGANGRTGMELVKQGLERNYRVTAFVRDDKALLEDSTLRKNQNLLIARLMSNDTTISSHSQVVLNIAMNKHGVRRLIVVTSYGCLGLRNYLISTKKLFSRMFMTRILKDKVLQEDIIQRDSTFLDWTIVRPITLKDGDLSEKYWLSSDELPHTNKVKALTRRDLAHYLLGIINAPEEHHAIRSIAGKPKMTKPKAYCLFDRRRETVRDASEPAKLQKEQEIKQQQQYPPQDLPRPL
ncbi:hypothetical protein BGZ58_010607 [Dissophora ornata]|nr:hypothetical protein BGZ58_010607 [Dissophora ornata]